MLWFSIRVYKNNSRQKLHLLVLLLVKLLSAMRFTNASKLNTFNSRWMREKCFSSIALPVLPGGVTKVFQFFWTIMNNSLNFNWNPAKFNTKWALYSIIYSANLMEFEVVLKGIKECCKKEEKYEETRGTFGIVYLRNRWANSFQIWYLC